MPNAHAVDDPMSTLVVDPEAPLIPMLIVFNTPFAFAPLPMFIVDAAVDVPNARELFENVVPPENVCVTLAVVANVPVTFGSVNTRVDAVSIKFSSNLAFLVVSVLSCMMNVVDNTSNEFVASSVLFVRACAPDKVATVESIATVGLPDTPSQFVTVIQVPCATDLVVAVPAAVFTMMPLVANHAIAVSSASDAWYQDKSWMSFTHPVPS